VAARLRAAILPLRLASAGRPAPSIVSRPAQAAGIRWWPRWPSPSASRTARGSARPTPRRWSPASTTA